MISPEIDSGPTRALVVRAGHRACALPLADVRETMRPLPIEALAGLASYVRGIAVIRGVPTPVVDLGALLDGQPSADCRRFVTVRCGEGTVALAVGEVAGVQEFRPEHFTQMPSLAGDSAFSILDGQLVLLLCAGRVLPDDVVPAGGEASRP